MGRGRYDSEEAGALREAMLEGATLLAAKGYSGNAIRETAASKNAWANLPSRLLICARIRCVSYGGDLRQSGS